LGKDTGDMTKSQTETLREKILKGTQISFQKLLERTAREDGELVISKDDKIVRVKARDLK
jgi:hypothetical protein